MFLIDYTTALISYFVIAALFAYLLFREPEVNWGTSTSAFAYLSTLQSIMKLQNTPDHVRTFRPQILVLSGNPQERQALVTLGKVTSLLQKRFHVKKNIFRKHGLMHY